MIPYGRQEISEADVRAVVEVLRSDFLTQGPAVPAFEAAVAGYCGGRYAIAVNSATSALHLACLALGVGPGDRVWTSPISFVASANCALYCGATVDFVDIDPGTCNLSPERLADQLARASRRGLLPKVVVPVDLAGEPCDLAEIRSLAERYGFRILEDASHAVGASYRGERVGRGTFSDITVFSFHPVKIVTTGEGGIALTNDPRLADRLRLLRSHGITRDPETMTRRPDGGWYYEQVALGFNYRMTDIQAALGSSQMTRIEEFVAARQAIASRYDGLLAKLPVVTPRRAPENRSALHLYVVRLRTKEVGRTHPEVFEALRNDGIGVNLHYIPIYRQPYYAALGYEFEPCPEADRYYEEAISIPIFPGLTTAQQERVVEAMQAATV